MGDCNVNVERLERIGARASYLIETEGYDEGQALEIACLDPSWPEQEDP
jgi:hypothetical protein